jgi:hypothetical protein
MYFYNWFAIYPFLSIIFENTEIIKNEIENNTYWVPWPEKNLYNNDSYKWDIIPFVYTLPSNNVNNKKWIKFYCEKFPKTTKLLKEIPGLRTALISKMGKYTIIDSHTGWGELSNYVLRCHIPLYIPKGNKCGVSVGGHIKKHNSNDIICFDDSKIHNAFNFSPEDRIVIIIDIIRPEYLPIGKAKYGKTKELISLMDLFK